MVNQEKKLCFVIMGYGEKVDPSTNKKLDLDKTYKSIIKPAVESAGLRCIRGDEIKESGLIDRSMYALLMHADLVVADITTANPNAIYELGVRHAVRPYATIIVKEEEGQIPFDLNSQKILHYKHLGPDIGVEEAQRAQSKLKEIVQSVMNNQRLDSPLYESLRGVTQPQISEEELNSVLGDLAKKENSIFAIVEQAKSCVKQTKFKDAVSKWKLACEAAPHEDYFIQQLALATYKSEYPSKGAALDDALRIIEPLAEGHDTNDPETLGITGAIYKRKWELSKDIFFLERAIKFYKKGFEINSDHYTGENFALCLNMKSAIEPNERKKIHYEISAEEVRETIIKRLADVADALKSKPSVNDMWQAATLAQCYFALNAQLNAELFENIFLHLCDQTWQQETYFKSKLTLASLLGLQIINTENEI